MIRTAEDVKVRIAVVDAVIEECDRERTACLERAASLLDRVYEAKRERKMLAALAYELRAAE